MALDDPILLIGDQPPECPLCGCRLDVDWDNPVGHDADGPIHKAACSEHGEFSIQDEPEDIETEL